VDGERDKNRIIRAVNQGYLSGNQQQTTQTKMELPQEVTAFYERLENNIRNHPEQWEVTLQERESDAGIEATRLGDVNRFVNKTMGITLLEVDTKGPFGSSACVSLNGHPMGNVPDGLFDAIREMLSKEDIRILAAKIAALPEFPE
jgi:hypothetical protein